MQFVPVNQRKMRRFTKFAAVFAGLALLFLGIYLRSWYGGIVGVMLLLAAFFTKKLMVDERGVVVEYRLAGLRWEELWAFPEIESVHIEYRGQQGWQGLHFKRGALSRVLVFPEAVAQQVLELCRHRNPQIYLGESS